MNILHIVAGLPSKEKPYINTFIQSQIDSLKKIGLNIYTYNLQNNHSKLNYFKSIFTIRKLVRKHHIEIIHAHYSYCGFTAILANTKIPIVLSLMGSDVLGSPNLRGNQTVRGRFDIQFTKLIAPVMDNVIVKSAEMKKAILPYVDAEVIPNGVNFEIFSYRSRNETRKKLGFDEGDFIVLFLGNPDLPRKNFALAQKAVADFKRSKIDVKLINPYGISNLEVAEYMNLSDVLLLTSHWEGSPNVIKEAMACNLPIISTNVGDVKERIMGTKNCFIVDFDKNEIVEKLTWIYKNLERSDGSERIRQLDENLVAAKIYRLYKNLNKRTLEWEMTV